jgi:lipid-binding SYLF domain-containing protein
MVRQHATSPQFEKRLQLKTLSTLHGGEKNMKKFGTCLVASLVGTLFLFEALVWAQNKEEADLIVDKSRIILEDMMNSPDSAPPTDFIRDCAGIAIIPGLVKAGFVVGGSYGKGVVLARRNGTWSGPAFVYIGAGSLGFQIGVQLTDLLLVVIGDGTMRAFLKSKFKLGADAAIAAGPIGAQATAATEILLRGGIFSYSRAKGLFAGVSLEGAGMGTEFGLNRAYYDTTSSPEQILYGEVNVPPSGKKLIQALEKVK